MQIPVEVVLGPFGALALALLWIWDLRRQNAALTERLNRFLDKIEVAPREASK